MCYSGWKGLECDVPQGQCVDPSCGGHGTCAQGSCTCEAGYRGESCEDGNERVDSFSFSKLFPALSEKSLPLRISDFKCLLEKHADTSIINFIKVMKFSLLIGLLRNWAETESLSTCSYEQLVSESVEIPEVSLGERSER